MVNGSVIKKILFVYFHKYCERLGHDIELIMGANFILFQNKTELKAGWHFQ